MEMDPNPPSFNLQYNVAPLNLGEAYSKGMTAGQTAGESLGKGISGAFDVMNRNRTADDTLTAMNQAGMLSKDAYDAVAGKALGAKEQMLGMYAGQWIAQQAQNRELQKQGYAGNVQIGVEHAKLLDTISAVKSGYGLAAGVQPSKLPVQPNQPNQANQQTQQVQRGQLVGTPPGTAAMASSAQPISNLTGFTGAPSPLASVDISRPFAQQPTPLKIGAPIGKDEQIPPGAKYAKVRGQPGILWTDGITFRPLPGQQ